MPARGTKAPARSAPQRVDLVIKRGTLLLMDPDRQVLDDGALAIRRGRIEAVGRTAEIVRGYRANREIDASGNLVMPGLINSHTHVIQILLRGGLSQDRALYDWLFNVLYPGLSQYSPDDARLAATLYCVEAIRGGITTIVDNADQGRSDDVAAATIAAFRDVGIRAVYARMFFDAQHEHLTKLVETVVRKAPGVKHTADLIETTDEALSHIESLAQRFDNTANGRIRVWPAPSLPNITTEEGLLMAAEMAERHGVMVTLHLAEAPLDAQMHGMTSTEYLQSIGFLSPRVLAAHCVYCNDRDLRLLKAYDVKVAHNPISNLFIASGFAPVSRMVGQGITVGLGTDDPNANESVNIIEAMKIAALSQRGVNLDASAITAEKIVEMATVDGARAIGMETEIGSLEPGKKADVILLNLNQAQLQPMHHIPNALVYQAYGSEVDTTIIDGQVLMERRELQFLDTNAERTLYREAQHASESIARRAGLEGLDRGWKTVGR